MSTTHDALIITMADVSAAGYCATGCRTWFKARNLNMAAFLANGLTVKDARILDDAMVNTVIDIRIKRYHQEMD